MLPQAEALLLAAQQADSIYSTAFQELALQVTCQLSVPHCLVHVCRCVLARSSCRF